MPGRLLRLLWLGWFLAMLALAPGCAPIRYDHDLVGKVVDSETGKPIPGAVILAEWIKRHPSIAGGHGSFYDAKETVADEHGQFEIRGRGLRFLTNVQTSHAYVFKAGYDWVGTDYERLQESSGIVRLQKIDKKIMRKRFPPMPTDARLEQIVNFKKEINIVLLELGLEPFYIPKGK